MSGAAGRGAAAAALIVALGSAAPAFGAPWAGPSLDDGEAAGSARGTDPGHEAEHHKDSSGHDDHAAAGSDASAGADDGHDSHDGDASEHSDPSSEHSGDSSEHSDDAGHEGEADTVSPATKARVLGGFGVVNAAAVGGAFLLRGRDRRSASKTGRVRADQADRADRDRTRRAR